MPFYVPDRGHFIYIECFPHAGGRAPEKHKVLFALASGQNSCHDIHASATSMGFTVSKPLILESNDGKRDRIDNWSSVSGIHVETIRSRIKKGKSLDEALKPVRKIGIEWQGKFLSVRDIVEMTGESDVNVYQRISSGWTPRQILMIDPPPGRIEWEGEFVSISELARRYGKSRQAIDHRLKAGMDLKEALETPIGGLGVRRVEETKTGIMYEGEFLDVKKLVELTGLSNSAIRQEISARWTPRQILRLDPPPGMVEWEGEFLTVTELARRHGKSPRHLFRLIEAGMDIRQAMAVPPPTRGRPRKADKNNNHRYST